VDLARLIPDTWDLELVSEPFAWVSRSAVEMRSPGADWAEGTELGAVDALAAAETAEAIVGRVRSRFSARGIGVPHSG